MRRLILVMTFIAYAVGVEDRDRQKNILLLKACERNPDLTICHSLRKPRAEHHSFDSTEKVVPPPIPREVRRRMDAQKDQAMEQSRDSVSARSNMPKESFASLPSAHSQLQQRCSKIAPIAQENCAKGKMVVANVNRCKAYFRDCSPFLSEADPLYSIANAFESGVALNLGTWGVKGIPYYPVNEEGAIGSGTLANIPFGSWGGGYSDHVGVRDYWSQYQEVGANWYEGKYGYKNGWSVPLVQSLGVEGGARHTASVPLDKKHFGAIDVDNGYHVGGYADVNDHVGVNWKRGDVQHLTGVGVPFAGVGYTGGQAVAFPGLDVWERALGR